MNYCDFDMIIVNLNYEILLIYRTCLLFTKTHVARTLIIL